MRGDQRLERGKSDARRRCSARVGTGAALALVLVSAVARAGAADRPDLRHPEAGPVLPDSEPVLELAPRVPASELSLFWFDPKGLFPDGRQVSKEVSRIFRGVGVDIRWVRAGSDTVFGEGGGLDIPVILLPEDPMPARASRRVLGLVPREPSGPRAVWVFLANVRWTLGHNPRSALILPRERHEVALALARVVAHEVVHAVAPEEPHTSSGLMHHSMDRTFLLGAHAPVDPDCRSAFLRRLGALADPATAATAARVVPEPDISLR
jgi:hypothetical protein